MRYYYSVIALVLLITVAACGSQPQEQERLVQPVQDASSAASVEPESELQAAELTPSMPAQDTEEAVPTVEATPVEAESGPADTAQAVEPPPSEPVQPVEAAPDDSTAVDEPAQSGEIAPADNVVENWLTVEGKTEDNLSYLGNPDAPVTIIDYSDFLWGACRSYVVGTEPELKEQYVKTGQVRLVFNPMLDHGDRSFQAHQAAECAGDQGKFWAMHDAIFENQFDLFGGDIQETLKGLAEQNGLDSQQFGSCLDEQRYAELVQSQDDFRRAQGVRARPTFDINGQLVAGAQGFPAFQNIVEAELVQ